MDSTVQNPVMGPLFASRAAPDPFNGNATTEFQLDEDITKIRSEIQQLSQRRKLLSSTLLSSSNTQALIQKHQHDPSPAATAHKDHATTNLHRLAHSATSFSFKDPSEPNDRPLLGIRIDISSRNGKYIKPYYVLLQRVGKHHTRLRVHRHTIPPFIPLRDMEERWLPSSDEDIWNSEMSSEDGEQNIHQLVEELRSKLVSWHARTESIEYLKEVLGLGNMHGDMDDMEDESSILSSSSLHVVSIASTSLEARYMRIEWRDGTVGRLKLSDNGLVERAVIIGEAGRAKDLEHTLTKGPARVEELAHRLHPNSNT